MPFSRENFPPSRGAWELGIDVRAAVEEKRQATRSSVLGAGTFACRRCDAPIDPGPRSLLLTESVACPFCDHQGLVRDFVSLTAPTRPARVVLRVSHGQRH